MVDLRILFSALFLSPEIELLRSKSHEASRSLGMKQRMTWWQWRIQGGAIGAIAPPPGWSDKIDFLTNFQQNILLI